MRLLIAIPDATGVVGFGPGLGATGGWDPGDVKRFHAWNRDPTGSPCGANFNLSNGVEIAFES